MNDRESFWMNAYLVALEHVVGPGVTPQAATNYAKQVADTSVQHMVKEWNNGGSV